MYKQLQLFLFPIHYTTFLKLNQPTFTFLSISSINVCCCYSNDKKMAINIWPQHKNKQTKNTLVTELVGYTQWFY